MLTVKSFGKFQITYGEHILNDELLRSDMLKKLLIYMLTHREHPASIQELSEALWQEEDIMRFSADASMYYKAGICYGNGTYSLTEKGVMVVYAGDEDEDDAGFNLLLVDRGDKLRIAMDQYGDGSYVYWVKK